MGCGGGSFWSRPFSHATVALSALILSGRFSWSSRLDGALFGRGTLGFGLTGLILELLIGLGPGLVALSTLAVFYLLLNAAINGAGHTFGYKGSANDATNLRPLALITFGEGLHNNHHARPASPKLSAFRGEFDSAWPVIRLLAALRLAEVLSKVDEEGWENHRRRIPRTVVSPGPYLEGGNSRNRTQDAAA